MHIILLASASTDRSGCTFLCSLLPAPPQLPTQPPRQPSSPARRQAGNKQHKTPPNPTSYHHHKRSQSRNTGAHPPNTIQTNGERQDHFSTAIHPTSISLEAQVFCETRAQCGRPEEREGKGGGDPSTLQNRPFGKSCVCNGHGEVGKGDGPQAFQVLVLRHATVLTDKSARGIGPHFRGYVIQANTDTHRFGFPPPNSFIVIIDSDERR